MSAVVGQVELKWADNSPRESHPSPLHIDISVEKYKHRLPSDKSGFGRTFIHVTGSNTDQLFIADHTIHIPLPGQTGLRTLHLIYTHGGQVNLPVNQRDGVYGLLKDNRQHLVDVTSVTDQEKPQILIDIREGKFDLIATAKDKPHALKLPNITQNSSQNNRFPVETETFVSNNELQLLRIWRTGEFFTYNHKTGNLNKLQDSRVSGIKPVISTKGTYKVFPSEKDWNYAFDEQTNFYKKYLIQDEISERLPPQNNHSVTSEYQNEALTNSYPRLPPLNLRLPEQKRYSLHKSWSFSPVSKNTFYQRYLRGDLPLQRSLTDRVERKVHRLTCSNVLRHEFYQHKKPLPSLSMTTMDQNKHKNASFDADDALQEQNLKCTVCKNFYDTKDRAPHILYCLHSCCYACLRTRTRSEMVQCPVCNEVCEVPNNEIDVLPVDHARQHLVKFFKIRNRAQEIGCDSCDPRNRATHRCRECDEFLCGVCTEAHKRTKVTKGHNIFTVESLKKANLDEFHHKRTCPIPEHEDQHFSFYCYSKGCDLPICSLCAVTEHNKADGHDIRNINDVYVENKRIVEGLLIDVKHKKNMADEAIQSIEDEIQNLYIKESSTDEELDQAFLACQKQLEKRKNELKEKLAATSKAKKKGMESQLDKLIAEKNSLDHAQKFASNVLGYSDATEFLQIKDSLYGRLGELKEMEIDTRPHNKADIKFHAHKMLDGFQKFSNKMGEVWSSTAFIPNTKIQTYDIGLGREETAMMITLHDYERRPLAEPGVDIRVEVTNPTGKKARAQVIDLTDTEGAYKVIYQGTKLGEHRASVFVLGMPVIDPGVTFKVRRPGALEEDVMKDYDDSGKSTVRAIVDSEAGSQRKDSSVSSIIPRIPGLHHDEEGDRPKPRIKSYRVFGDIICPDFCYDPTTCHPQNMVTSDSRTLKNVRGRTANIGTALKNYRGAIATKPFSKTGRFYFEVVVYFFIKRQLRNDLIFEVAIARKPDIDKNYTVDGSPYAWTVCARRCPLCRTVCLMTFHNGVRLYHNPLTENSPPGTTLRTTIGFLMDMNTKQWFIVDAKNRRLFFRFKGIDITKPIWPVFGAYSTEYVSVSLALKTGKDIQAVPDIPSDIQ